MQQEKRYYYQTYLEVNLKNATSVFGFINISHISYVKLEELFKNQVRNEKFLFDDSMSYFIDKELYQKNKVFFDIEIPFTFDFNIFEYWVSLTGDYFDKLEKYYYDELPEIFTEYRK